VRDKHDRLLELARRRQMTRWTGYKCIGDYHGGAYECDFVSPYTKAARNVNSELMVLLQDWSSDDVLNGPYLPEGRNLGHDSSRVTNRRLRKLLWQHFRLELEQVYATNVFPFIKAGPMKAAIPRRDLERAAREFALPQIRIVGPRLAVCLGKSAFNAVAVAAGGRPAGSLADAIARPFEIGRTQVRCQAHTGQQGTNYRNQNVVDQVTRDWALMASAYHCLKRDT
jgi:restriction system protein